MNLEELSLDNGFECDGKDDCVEGRLKGQEAAVSGLDE